MNHPVLDWLVVKREGNEQVGTNRERAGRQAILRSLALGANKTMRLLCKFTNFVVRSFDGTDCSGSRDGEHADQGSEDIHD